MKTFVTHRRAAFDFELLDIHEAGIELLGAEVKAIRSGKGVLEGAHIIVRGDEAYLVGASIPAHQPTNAPSGYDQERVRRLLLSRKEIDALRHQSDQKGLTIVPLSVYSSRRNIKLNFALARGKKKYDKRETIKKRDTERHIERTLKN